jgi:hypothetical protein
MQRMVEQVPRRLRRSANGCSEVKQQPLPQLATGHVKLTVSLGPQRTLNGHQNKARYCEINIRDACVEPASLMSQRTGHVLVTGFYGARYFVGKFVMGVPIEARYSVVSL